MGINATLYGASTKIGASALQQIGALEAEKKNRTPAQQKIDSRLLYADRMRRGVPIASGVHTQQVALEVDAHDGQVRGQPTSDNYAGTPYALRSVAYGNGSYVAAGDNGWLVTSADGTNWVSTSSVTINNLESVVYGRGTFVRAGDNGTITESVAPRLMVIVATNIVANSPMPSWTTTLGERSN